MSNKQFLPLPTSVDNFAELITSSCYYVDKTPYLKEVFADITTADDKSKVKGSNVLLFTRPRRFGKTLLMNMFESFLQISGKEPGNITKHLNYFKGTKILEDQDFCDKYMGQCPVISITLKDVCGDDFESAYLKLAEVVSNKAKEFSFLKDSSYLDESDKAKFNLLIDEIYLKKADKQAISYVTSAISSLSLMLYKHFNKQVYVLIDEYDVPLAKAAEKKYHDKMVSLMSSFFDVLKSTPSNTTRYSSPVLKVIMTGCLKVAKNSIFTGVNNVVVNTVLDTQDKFTSIIGFNKEETRKFLEDYNLADYENMVKANYDGYKFYDKEMFCPWDVIKFIANNYEHKLNGTEDDIKPGNYWIGTSSNEALYEYLGYLTDSDTQKMQDLVDGKTINFVLNDSMNYDCLSQHNPDDFWSLLLHTGYLTLDWEDTKALEDPKKKGEVQTLRVSARIPNLEIKQCFKENIQNRFKTEIAPHTVADALANNLFSGKSDIASDTIYNLLQNFISVKDNATKAPHENYYHGYLNGLFSNCSKDFFSEYHSNYESGDGYADIIFKNKKGNSVVVIEIKTCKGTESKTSKSREALAQIEEKNYSKPYLENEDITTVYAYGIAFSGKSCLLSCKKIK